MKKLVLAALSVFVFLGCSSNATNENVKPALVVTQSIENLQLNDQHEVPQTIAADTKKIIFAFSKDVGHTCNDFFATKTPSYLADNKVMFVADVSGAPSLIRSMFILPGLKDFKHTVLVIEDKTVSASYKAGMESEKIVVVSLENKMITEIKTLSTTSELEAEIEK
jgi:ATP-dependent phosphoenolpyruvate carboxykinase